MKKNTLFECTVGDWHPVSEKKSSRHGRQASNLIDQCHVRVPETVIPRNHGEPVDPPCSSTMWAFRLISESLNSANFPKYVNDPMTLYAIWQTSAWLNCRFAEILRDGGYAGSHQRNTTYSMFHQQCLDSVLCTGNLRLKILTERGILPQIRYNSAVRITGITASVSCSTTVSWPT